MACSRRGTAGNPPAARVDCKLSGATLSGRDSWKPPEARVDCKLSGAALSGMRCWEASAARVDCKLSRAVLSGRHCWQPQQLKLTVNYRVLRSRVGGSQNVRNLLLEPKWAPVVNVRLGKGSVKTIWRGSARWPAPGEALLATPQQLELTVNYQVPRSRGGTPGNHQKLELTVNSPVPHPL